MGGMATATKIGEDIVTSSITTRTSVLEDHAAAAQALVAAVEARDAATGSHSTSVVRLSMEILRALDPRVAADPFVPYGFLLHDIGKLAVPDEILLKPGELTSAEWEVMKQHPVWGAQIVERIPCLRTTQVMTVVRHHHERWDGLGYPDGLVGEDVPLACRAFAVVDAFDAMTMDRPYRPAMPVDAALDEIWRGRGTQFAPAAVDAFAGLLAAAAA